MAQLVEQGMREGAIGLSSGLEYDVGSYSDTEEMVEVAAAAAKHGGFYMTHVRDEADKSFEALEEEIAIGERRGFRSSTRTSSSGTVNVWDKAPEYIRSSTRRAARGVDLPRRLLSVRSLALQHQGARAEQAVRGSARASSRRSPSVGGARRITITEFAPNRATRSTPSSRSRRPQESRRSTCTFA